MLPVDVGCFALSRIVNIKLIIKFVIIKKIRKKKIEHVAQDYF